MADDSGLAVDVLGGAPAFTPRVIPVKTRPIKEPAKLLETLKDVRTTNVGHVSCVLVYLRLTRKIPSAGARGNWPGVITREPAGTGGFGL
ncbi:hypothetical protein DMH88_14270 [Escherichia coli]|nr:hypothetical protein [Escherichia coli]